VKRLSDAQLKVLARLVAGEELKCTIDRHNVRYPVMKYDPADSEKYPVWGSDNYYFGKMVKYTTMVKGVKHKVSKYPKGAYVSSETIRILLKARLIIKRETMGYRIIELNPDPEARDPR